MHHTFNTTTANLLHPTNTQDPKITNIHLLSSHPALMTIKIDPQQHSHALPSFAPLQTPHILKYCLVIITTLLQLELTFAQWCKQYAAKMSTIHCILVHCILVNCKKINDLLHFSLNTKMMPTYDPHATTPSTS